MLLLKDQVQIFDYIFRSILLILLVTWNSLNALLKLQEDIVSARSGIIVDTANVANFSLNKDEPGMCLRYFKLKKRHLRDSLLLLFDF